MSDEFANLTVPEIQALVDRAGAGIERRKEAGRETLKAEIAERLGKPDSALRVRMEQANLFFPVNPSQKDRVILSNR